MRRHCREFPRDVLRGDGCSMGPRGSGALRADGVRAGLGARCCDGDAESVLQGGTPVRAPAELGEPDEGGTPVLATGPDDVGEYREEADAVAPEATVEAHDAGR